MYIWLIFFFLGFNFDNRNFDLILVVKYVNFVNGILFWDKSIIVFYINYVNLFVFNGVLRKSYSVFIIGLYYICLYLSVYFVWLYLI